MEKSNDKLNAINAYNASIGYRPVENEVDKEKNYFLYYEITVIVRNFVPKVLIRNVALWNPIRAIDFALHDIKKTNPQISFEEVQILVKARATTDPESVHFDPSNPED